MSFFVDEKDGMVWYFFVSASDKNGFPFLSPLDGVTTIHDGSEVGSVPSLSWSLLIQVNSRYVKVTDFSYVLFAASSVDACDC